RLSRAVVNQHRVWLPRGVTRASPWPRVDHLASRLFPATIRPFRTRFRFGSLSLNPAPENNWPAHYAKGTRSGIPADCSTGIALPLLVGIRFQVLFHSPHRGSFHLSLTVLVHYRSPGSI